ncbi:GM22488 [Drosophila sechellia]|uniref:GM22488 n=1 Tax=Drosophila sechellia TaxID=7238 RepID=B4IKT2_DROSE|nr:GM22488 [Drosophila sechellia]
MERLIGRVESSLNMSTAINSERDLEEAVDTLIHNIKAAVRLATHSPSGRANPIVETRSTATHSFWMYVRKKICGAGVPQGSVLGPLLYCLYSYDIRGQTLAYPDDVCVTYRSCCEHDASTNIQDFASTFSEWARRWSIGINGDKSAHVCYTLKRKTPPAVLRKTPLAVCRLRTPVLQSNTAKYLGVIFDRRLNFSKQVSAMRVRIRAAATKHFWLINSRSKLSLSNKVTIYKQILAPIWKYGCRRFQAAQKKIARTITEWYVKNSTLHKDLKLATVFKAINMHSSRFPDKLERHRNCTAKALSRARPPRSLHRRKPKDLIIRSPLTRARR